MSIDAALLSTNDPMARHHAYQALIIRLRELIHQSVPPGMTVAVVSKGDADLVSLIGRSGWHFPQDGSGGYAGYHPRDSAAAIEGLEALRSRGADFLALPATATWWLEHYADFANHLRLHYEMVVEQTDTGVIYALRPEVRRAATQEGTGERDVTLHRSALLAEQINDLASRLLPEACSVVLVDLTGATALQLEGRVTTHLGVTLPSSATASAVAATIVSKLEELRSQGAGCLIIARGALDWWKTDDVVRPHIEQRYRCVTQQAHVCFMYDLQLQEAATL